jgi:hypothetical protein
MDLMATPHVQSLLKTKKRSIIASFVIAFIIFSNFSGAYPYASAQQSVDSIMTTPELPIIETYHDRWATIPETSSTPQIDGRLNEQLWAQAAGRSGFLTMYYNKKMESDVDTEVKLTYDSTYLYIGIKGQAGAEGHPPTERVDILLAPQGVNDRYYQIPVVINHGPREIRTIWQWEHESLAVEGVQTVVDQQATYWTAEIAVPLLSLQSAQVQPGEEWRINVLRYYGIAAPRPFSSLVPLRTSYIEDTGGDSYFIIGDVFNHGRMGSFFFRELPEVSSQAGLQTWETGQAELRYKSFNEKELYLPEGAAVSAGDVLGLYWRTPDQQRLPISQFTVEPTWNRISFTHPDPKDRGMYQLELVLNDNNIHRYMLLSFDKQAMVVAGDQLNAHLLVEPEVERTAVAAVPASSNVQKLLGIIPPQPGIIFATHPEMPELAPNASNFTWSFNNPNVLTGVETGTVYPNAQFLETETLTATNRKGEKVEYPYYADAEGKKYFITAHLWYRQKEYALTQTRAIATSDPLGAARLLYRFAEMYQQWVPTNDYPWHGYPTDIQSGPPYHYWGGTWYRWYASDLYYMRQLAEAYAIVKKTNAFDVLSQEVGKNVERIIVDDMFKPSVELIDTYTILNHNMEPGVWHGLIALSKALGDPRYLHDAVDRIENFASNQFLLDGFFREVTASYHNQTTSGMTRSLAAAKGWSDPEGYISARTGQNYQNIDLGNKFPILIKAIDIVDYATYPDGKYLPNQDTWASSQSAKPRLSEGSLMLPGAGIARLTRGMNEEQQQLYMTYSPKYGHNHLDPLNLTLFAEGQELLPDIGYTHSLFGKWKKSTLAHNTVVVDSKDMSLPEGRDGGNIERFIPVNETVQVMKASQENAYPGIEEYSREPWSIGFNGAAAGESYIVDLFRVYGGNRHEYTLNGDANRDASFKTELPLADYGPYLLPEGVKVTLPTTEREFGDAEGHYYGYIYVQDVKSADIANGQYEVTLQTEAAGEPMANLKITGFVGEGNNELFIGQSPSMRSTRLNGSGADTNIEAVKYFMPKLVVRKEGVDLHSQFITVMEPYAAAADPRIEQIVQLQPVNAQEGDAALAVTYGNTTDIILSSPFYSGEPLIVGDIELHGQMGFIRLEGEKIKEMHLIGGTLLKKGNVEVDHTGAFTGTISGVMREVEGAAYNGFVVDSPVSDQVKGQYIIVTHPDESTHGYKIKEVIRENGQTIIQTDDMDPGFQFASDGSSEMKFYPPKQWNGAHTFRIENLAQYMVGLPSFRTFEGERMEQLVGGEVLRVTAETSNGLPYDVPITLIVALKNEQHSVESVRYVEKLIGSNQTEMLNVAFPLPLQVEGYYVEAFLWNSLDGQQPVTKSIRLSRD